MKKKNWLFSSHITIAALIGFVALALRLWGAGWSLPYVDHPDEPAIVKVLLRINKGELNPKHFFYPSLILYLQALVLKLHFWWGHLTGLYPESFTLPNSAFFYTTIPGAFLWARTTTALIGTAAVVTLATWGASFVGKRAALLSATSLALSSWAIIHDHYITVDGPSAFTALLALLAALQVLERGSWQDYIRSGIFIGLAAGTKYQNVLVAASVVLAHGLHWRKETFAYSPRLIVAGLVSAIVFFLTTPYIVLAPQDFMHDIQTLLDSYSNPDIAHGDVTGAWPIAAYLSFYWRECLTPIPCILALIGISTFSWRKPAQSAVILIFPILMIISLLRPQTHFYRNLLPTLPPLLLMAGIGTATILDFLNRSTTRTLCALRSALSPFVLCALLLIPSLITSFQASARFAQPDSRVLAQAYARQNFPGTRIASELSHPMLWQGIAQSSYIHYLPKYPPAWYRQNGYGLLLTNSGRRKSEEWTPDYTLFLQSGRVIATFGGRDSGLLGPRIDIIDIGLTTADAPIQGPRITFGPLHLLGATIGTIEKRGNELKRKPSTTIQAGKTLAITLFWTIPDPVPLSDYTVFIHLRNQQGKKIAQRDAHPWLGLFPPTTWRTNSLVVEEQDIPLAYEIPPGEYQLVIGLYNSATQARYPAFQGNMHLADDEGNLGKITIIK